VIARIEETPLGLNVRYIITSLKGSARHLYETVYCARGQAENFIKLHKAQFASDRTSCRDPRANQFRLILHTAAYWLLHWATRGAVASSSPSRKPKPGTTMIVVAQSTRHRSQPRPPMQIHAIVVNKTRLGPVGSPCGALIQRRWTALPLAKLWVMSWETVATAT
jgi:hypothetical protein